MYIIIIIMNMEWGSVTWFLLHGLAEKIKSEEFMNKREELLHLFFLICSNLPCPYCQEHAKVTIRSLKIKNINSKEDFQKVIWSFHNMVNKRKKYTLFSFEECKEKYSKANILMILEQFSIVWSKNYKIIKMMNDTLKRTRCVDFVKKWVYENKVYFNQ
mgnify:FL=1